ncbi:MAG: 2-oxo acid dehydrogenase subunit E2 [Bacteroidetes bacterium]|nr:2-oxo acid dehydrogenase subunit E2 [Bacteroidota bacterium]
MALVDVVMPRLGESIMEATILRWHKKPGDAVRQDESLLDIATDKVDSEIPSPADGILEESLFAENDIVPIGSVIARIRTTDDEASIPTPSPAAATSDAAPIEEPPTPSETADPIVPENTPPPEDEAPEAITPEVIPVPPEPVTTDEPTPPVPYQPETEDIAPAAAHRFYSPLVLNIATREGIPLSELEALPGSGAEGRVTKKDILEYVEQRKAGAKWPHTMVPADTKMPEPSVPYPTMGHTQPEQIASKASHIPHDSSEHKNVEIMEMDRMRRLIADHMVKSKATSAHVTSFAEADVTSIVQWRERVRAAFEQREGEKITFTPVFIEAIAKCLRKHPLLNSSVEGDRILIRKDINIGMAAALPNGNLIVPVIRGADQLSLVGLTKQVNRLAKDARSSRLNPDDVQGGTFTFTNVGTYGSLMGTPIINQPQVAILATGVIKKKPVVIDTPTGDTIGIRHMMFVSMSYDHRIIDGALGASFLRDVVKELESFDPARSL